jgi:hypothetical protein
MRWLALCVLLTGCSTVVDGEPSTAKVDGYLEAMAQHFPGSKSQDYLDVGTSTCDRLRSGKTRDEVIEEKVKNGLTPGNALTIVQLSIEYLCDEFADK